MNKFEQVSGDHQQMSLAGGRSLGLMSWVGEGRRGRGRGGFRRDLSQGVPNRVTYPMMHLMLPKAPPP